MGKTRLPLAGTELEWHDTREEGRNPGQPDFLSEWGKPGK